MKQHRVFKVLKILLMVAIAITLFGFVTMWLWNWLMPTLFGLRAISFAQALGLLVLSKILFGGFRRHGGRGGWRGRWGRRWEERWAQMSLEERERFRSGMNGRRRCGWNPPPEPASESTAP